MIRLLALHLHCRKKRNDYAVMAIGKSLVRRYISFVSVRIGLHQKTPFQVTKNHFFSEEWTRPAPDSSLRALTHLYPSSRQVFGICPFSAQNSKQIYTTAPSPRKKISRKPEIDVKVAHVKCHPRTSFEITQSIKR